jgi:hypothetical protein
VTSFSKYTRALTFENFCQAGAAESKPPGMGLLKQQMRHLDVLRQRLAKLAVQTGGRLSRLTSGRARPLPPPSSLESSLLGHLSVLRRRLDRLSGREAGEDRGGGGKDRGGGGKDRREGGGTREDAHVAQVSSAQAAAARGAAVKLVRGSGGVEYLLDPLGKASTEAAAQGAGRGRPTEVPADESTRLWDFPDIKKYMVIRSRANFWPEMDKMNKEHTYESTPFQWPEPTADTGQGEGGSWVRTASKSLDNTVVKGQAANTGGPATQFQNAFPSAFDWPQPQGDTSAFPASTFAHELYVKAGGLLKRGDIMPKTRPHLLWSAACSFGYLYCID